MSDYTTKDAIGYAMSGDVASFKSAVSDILMDKVNDALEVEKMRVASTFMSAETEEDLGDPDGN
jgi:hypothetical protein